MTVLQRVAELRAAGRDVISLCAGEPSQGAPSDVKRRLGELMIDRTPLGYSETFGLRSLREAIARHYRRWYDLEVPVEQIAVTTGSSGAFVVSFLAAFDPGDRVVLARPGYPAYRNILSSLGCEVVELACGPSERFQPTPALLDAALAAGPIAGLVLASPANPTGTMVDRDQLTDLVAWCREHDVRLISDEIYHGIVDEAVAHRFGPGCCAWQLDRSAVVISSFSKYAGMTGWRLGWALVPDDLVGPVDALAGNYALCAPVPAQHAAIEAFTESSYAEAEAAVREFAAARSLVLDAVDDLGWTKVAPADGAFYVWADIAEQLGPYLDSGAWCAALLDAQGVAVTPGSDFDSVDGRTAIRLSLAAGPESVGAALLRIHRFQQELGQSDATRSRPPAAVRSARP